MRHFFVLLSVAAASACGDSSSSYGGGSDAGPSSDLSGIYEAADNRELFDEDAAREAAEEELSSEGYDQSYGCTYDCSGHNAGWQWRAEHGYSTDGNSQSFSGGGIAFDEAIENRIDEMRADYESGIEPSD